jgi:hypothetical protein
VKVEGHELDQRHQRSLISTQSRRNVNLLRRHEHTNHCGVLLGAADNLVPVTCTIINTTQISVSNNGKVTVLNYSPSLKFNVSSVQVN